MRRDPREGIELAARARDRLTAGLDQVLGEQFRRPDGQKVDFYEDGIVISSFTLFDRPDEDTSPRAPFADSAFNARRRVGLMALRRLNEIAPPVHSGVGPTLSEAISAVMKSPDGWPVGLRDWVEGLDRSGQATVVAATMTWCEGALRLVGLGSKVLWSDPQFPTAATVPGRVVRLAANVDASIGTPATGEKLFVISEGLPSPTDRIRCGYVALVRALVANCAPERVTTGSPSRGLTTRVTITEEILELAVDHVVQAVAMTASSHSTTKES